MEQAKVAMAGPTSYCGQHALNDMIDSVGKNVFTIEMFFEHTMRHSIFM